MGQHEGQGFTDVAFPDILHEPLDPSRPFAVSAQATILRYFREVLEARPHVLANDDIEAVHEIRVAARRTRTALQTFSTLWNEKDVRRWLDYLAKIADAFTIARDTDVLIEYLEKQLKGTTDKPEQARRSAALAWLLARARRRREAEQPELEKLLRRSEKDHSAQDFVSFFAQHPVNLWQYNRPHPEGPLPGPQAVPAPDIEAAGQEADFVGYAAVELHALIMEQLEAEPQDIDLQDSAISQPEASEPESWEPEAPEAEWGQATESPAAQMPAENPAQDFVRVVLDNARRSERDAPSESATNGPAAENEAADPRAEAEPASTETGQSAGETDAAQEEAPRPFADIAHAVFEELSQLHEADAPPSVEAARYHPQEGHHGQG